MADSRPTVTDVDGGPKSRLEDNSLLATGYIVTCCLHADGAVWVAQLWGTGRFLSLHGPLCTLIWLESALGEICDYH